VNGVIKIKKDANFDCQLKLIGFFKSIIVAHQFSPTFFEQLLCAQIPKAPKKRQKKGSLFAHLGSAHVKAARRLLMKLTPGFLGKGKTFPI